MDSGDVKSEHTNLRLLIDAASVLQSSGGIASDNTFGALVVDSIDACHDRTDLNDTTIDRAIRRLEAMKDTLSDLEASCERELHALKAGGLTPSRRSKIQNLPDDILTYIFELSTRNGKTGSPRGEYVLLKVCKRFRSVTLRSPSLWTQVVSSMSSDEVITRLLRRSGNRSLTVIIDAFDWSDDLRLFIDLVAVHARRWGSLIIDPSPTTQALCGLLPPILGRLKLPRLESLVVTSGYADYADMLSQSGGTYFVDTPKLHYIQIYGRLPDSLSFFFTSRTVRFLEFFKVQSDLRALASYLTSLPDLTELHLTMYHDNYNSQPTLAGGISGVLPSLRKLTLEAGEDATLELFGKLHKPKLEVFNLKIQCSDHCNMTRLTGSYPSVTEVTITHTKPCGRTIDFERLFSAFPQVQRLSVDAAPPDSFSVDAEVRTPPLRTVSMKLGADNSGLDFLRTFSESVRQDAMFPPLLAGSVLMNRGANSHDFLRDFAERLKRDGRWDEFETFVLDDVASPKREVESILTKEKVKWID